MVCFGKKSSKAWRSIELLATHVTYLLSKKPFDLKKKKKVGWPQGLRHL